ncbi:MAG TPA: trehalase family glycosidase [Chloroflexia bacterium]|nr:trehalase family glycosidase [Chloroflexia bacterium]
MNGNQVLGYLSRRDKWFLGGGRMLIWAPEFPLWLDQPGFWDHACYLDYKVGPLFTISIIDGRGQEVRPQLMERYWQPDHSSQLYRDRSHDLTISERRALLPADVLCSNFELTHSLKQDQTFDIIVWSAQERFEMQGIYELEKFRARERDGTLVWQRRVRESGSVYDPAQPDKNVMLRFAVALGSNRTATSYSVRTSDRQPNYPRWKYSPFYEKLAEFGNLGNESPASLDPGFNGLTYFGLHYKVTVPAGSRTQFTVFASVGLSEEEALVSLQAARRGDFQARAGMRQPTADLEEKAVPEIGPHVEQATRERRPTDPAKRHWQDYFEGIPDFTCSDPYLQKYYWYRWYGLRLNTVRTRDERLRLPYPCVFEGINLGWFRQHIAYSAQCHMLETRWMHDPAIARGSLLNFIENQLEDGSFPGVIKNILDGDRTLRVGVAFYHSNWGMALRELHRVHPDRAFLERVYGPLTRYVGYFHKVRDADRTGLYDVIQQDETGMEFMNRYMQVDDKADLGGFFRLKGVDATVYIYQLQETLAWVAEEIGHPDARGWRLMAERTRNSIMEKMWDPQEEFFFDVNPATMQRTTAKAVTGFYPFLSESLAGKEHLGVFQRHLFNENEFWTPYPVPTTSRDDATFSPDGEWKGKRLVCPWNGRTWLMTNSHVAELLSRASLNLAPELQPQAVEFINRYIRMLFLDNDLERPSSYEYYNPITGQAPYFRGTEDYMHSWIVDLIIKYVAGVQPGDNGKLRIRPLPFNLDYFVLDKVQIAGKKVKVSWRKDESVAAPLRVEPQADSLPVGLAVWVDGQQIARASNLEGLEIQL